MAKQTGRSVVHGGQMMSFTHSLTCKAKALIFQSFEDAFPYKARAEIKAVRERS
jgi:hypothetical protein